MGIPIHGFKFLLGSFIHSFSDWIQTRVVDGKVLTLNASFGWIQILYRYNINVGVDSFIFGLESDWGCGWIGSRERDFFSSSSQVWLRLSRGIRMKVHQTIGADNFFEKKYLGKQII